MFTEEYFHSCRYFTAERDSLIKRHKEELTAAECQGKTHVLSRLPRVHQEQLTELNTRHAEEIASTHLFIQNMLDQTVLSVTLKPKVHFTTASNTDNVTVKTSIIFSYIGTI